MGAGGPGFGGLTASSSGVSGLSALFSLFSFFSFLGNFLRKLKKLNKALRQNGPPDFRKNKSLCWGNILAGAPACYLKETSPPHPPRRIPEVRRKTEQEGRILRGGGGGRFS